MTLPPEPVQGLSRSGGGNLAGGTAAAHTAAGGSDAGLAAAFPPAARMRFPNGLTVVPQSRVEAEHFYEDLFEKRIYLRHGVTLEPGDCVFDVGGNIGTFALFAYLHAPGARIYTFEPAPPLFRRLRANLALNGVAARAFDFGIAEAERKARFTFYPNSSGMSSFYADAEEEREVLRAMMRRRRAEGVEGMDALLEYGEELLDERFRAEEMECRLRPLSAVIREEGVTRIDLLKIDVQKAELDVLRGIADPDWPRIRQIVMEVHDLDGRLAEVTRLLEERGFRVAVEQDEAVEGSVLYNLFAVSRTVPAREADPLRLAAVPSDAAGAPPPPDLPEPPAPWHLLLLSASSPEALEAAAADLASLLDAHPELPLADLASTLRERPSLPHRRAVVAHEGMDAAALLRSRDPAWTADGVAADVEPSAVFLFPGVGEQYPGMARGLYAAEPVFRAEVDRCAGILRPHLGFDLRDVLFAAGGKPSVPPSGGLDLRRMLGRAPAFAAPARLHRTDAAQPAAFVVGFALARLWEAWGVRPAALLGHSLGEYTAACVAGVFSVDDALELVALRARAIQALPGGAMLAVSLSPEAVAPYLDDGVSLAAVNAPELCVLSGTDGAIARAERALARAGHATRRLAATHAFHSPLMRPVAERVAEVAARMQLAAPRIPMISNVTGTWLAGEDATDPRYWARHLVGAVQFARGAAELLADPRHVLVEMGPGGSLGAFVRQQAAAIRAAAPPGVASLPHAAEDAVEPAFVRVALGRLWTAGARPDWSVFPSGDRLRVPLPDAGARAGAADPPDAGVILAAADGGGDGDDGAAEVERALAGIWRELLDVEPRPADDFFLLGGHSLVATKLIARVRERFGVEMRLRNLFQTRTLAAVARWIEGVAAQGASPGEGASPG